MGPTRTASSKAQPSVCRGCLARPSRFSPFLARNMRARRAVRIFSVTADGLFGWRRDALTSLRGPFIGSPQLSEVRSAGFTAAWATNARHRGGHQLCLSILKRTFGTIDRARKASASRFFCWCAFDRYHYSFRSLAIASSISLDRSRSLRLCLSIAFDRFDYAFRSLAIASAMSFDRSRCLSIAFHASRSLRLCLSIAFDHFDYVFRSLSIANALSESTVDNRSGCSFA